MLRLTILTAILSLSLPACSQNGEKILIQSVTIPKLVDDNRTREVTPLEADDLIEDFEAYLGDLVIVRETVGKVLGESIFLLTDYHLFGGQNLLIINASGNTFSLPTGQVTDEVLVIGEVQRFEANRFKQEYGLQLDVDNYADYEKFPAILAQSIFPAPDPDEVTQFSSTFFDQVIAVEGEIDHRFTPNTFTLDEERLIGGEDLLVISTIPIPEADDDDDILAIGVLRQLDFAALERDYGLTWNLQMQQQLEIQFANQPVLVTEEVYRSED